MHVHYESGKTPEIKRKTGVMKVHYAISPSEINFVSGFDGGWPVWLLVLDGKACPRPSQKQVPDQVGVADREQKFRNLT